MNQAYDSYPLFFDDVHKDLIWGDRTGTGAYLPLRRGAELLPDGRVEYCNPCLDAVVKDGQFVPACLSDTDFAKGELPCG